MASHDDYPINNLSRIKPLNGMTIIDYNIQVGTIRGCVYMRVAHCRPGNFSGWDKHKTFDDMKKIRWHIKFDTSSNIRRMCLF